MKQPPSGGCVLKLLENKIDLQSLAQPPSGGCVLKPPIDLICLFHTAATFGWLCVETVTTNPIQNYIVGSHLRVAVW